MSALPDTEHERATLRQALTECRRRLSYYRSLGERGRLEADLAENDLNTMLDRLAILEGYVK